MRNLLASFLLCVSINSLALASGSNVTYSVGGSNYEGFYVSPSANAPLVILVHDWDGLNDYEIKRSEMLAAMGYAVFAVDLFGAGIKPTEMDHIADLVIRESISEVLPIAVGGASSLPEEDNNGDAETPK